MKRVWKRLLLAASLAVLAACAYGYGYTTVGVGVAGPSPWGYTSFTSTVPLAYSGMPPGVSSPMGW
jgi:hypothetical protein